MDKSEIILGLCACFFIGMLFTSIMIDYFGECNSTTLLKECEKTLPRNENCVIIAVPENNQNKR